jgi:hypothetical protein
VRGPAGTGGLASIVGGLGGAKNSPATVYPVAVSDEGIVTVEC